MKEKSFPNERQGYQIWEFPAHKQHKTILLPKNLPEMNVEMNQTKMT